MNVLSRILIYVIRLYQVLFVFKHPCCRFIPSCSVYGIEAIKRYGILKGVILIIKRILRCRPGHFGYDPVP